MVSPDPANPLRQVHKPESPAASRVLRTYGYQVLAVLLGIALAFM